VLRGLGSVRLGELCALFTLVDPTYDLRKDAGGCRQVPAGGRSSEDSTVTRRAHPSAGTGRHWHGDWMVT